MRTILIGAFCALLSQPLMAEGTEPPERPAAQGYVLGSIGSSLRGPATFAGVGGGGEGFFYRGLGVGAEAGYYAPAREPGRGVGIVSVNGTYHFQNIGDEGRLEPFVTAGYSLVANSDATNLVNYGGGVIYWFKPRVGMRLEVRNHQRGEVSLLAFRFGLSFR